MTEQGIVGLKGPDYQMPIEWGAIRLFAKSLYSSHPQWRDDPNAVVPPTFLQTGGYFWGYILERPPAGSEFAKLGMDRCVVMDGEQEYVFFGEPPRAGTVLKASLHIAEHFHKQGRAGGKLEFFVAQVDFRDASGALVAQWRTTSIRTEKPAVQSFAARERNRTWWHKGETRPQLDQIGPVDDAALAVGVGTPTVTMPPLTLTEIIRFQCASGEDNASHHDTLAARSFGYPEYFSVGMHHAGILSVLACHWLGPRNVRRFRTRFLDMVWPGDVLSYQCTVSALGNNHEGPTVDVELVCTRDGQPVVRAWATFLRQAAT